MRGSGSCLDLEAAQGLHRRDAAAHQQPARNGGGGGGRRRAQDGRLAGRARSLLSARWRLVALLLLGLTVRAGLGWRVRHGGSRHGARASQPPPTAAVGRVRPPAAPGAVPAAASSYHTPTPPPPTVCSCTR